jgi:phosphate transport system protein
VHEHIVRQFDRDLHTLKDRILLMAGMVEGHIAESMRALSTQDLRAAQRLARSDRPVNLLEMECDELCVRMIAQWQPAASDLRFIVAALKITTDLERIGDLAVNIAHRAEELAPQPKLDPPIDLLPMSAMVQSMLKKALDAFVRRDADAAEAVLVEDDMVDAAFRDLFATLIARMKRAENVERGVRLVFIAKSLERIADHATNIAEQVVFVARGQDVRHKSSVEQSSSPCW